MTNIKPITFASYLANHQQDSSVTDVAISHESHDIDQLINQFASLTLTEPLTKSEINQIATLTLTELFLKPETTRPPSLTKPGGTTSHRKSLRIKTKLKKRPDLKKVRVKCMMEGKQQEVQQSQVEQDRVKMNESKSQYVPLKDRLHSNPLETNQQDPIELLVLEMENSRISTQKKTEGQKDTEIKPNSRISTHKTEEQKDREIKPSRRISAQQKTEEQNDTKIKPNSRISAHKTEKQNDTEIKPNSKISAQQKTEKQNDREMKPSRRMSTQQKTEGEKDDTEIKPNSRISTQQKTEGEINDTEIKPSSKISAQQKTEGEINDTEMKPNNRILVHKTEGEINDTEIKPSRRISTHKTEGEKDEEMKAAVLRSMNRLVNKQNINGVNIQSAGYIDEAQDCDDVPKCQQETFPHINTDVTTSIQQQQEQPVTTTTDDETEATEYSYKLMQPAQSLKKKSPRLKKKKNKSVGHEVKSLNFQTTYLQTGNVCLMKKLVKAGKMFVVQENQYGSRRFSRVSLENGWVYLHCLRDQPSPPYAYTMPVTCS
ncbi:hypothetical protein Pmani_023426 [Petrolisthes manimaculis]|uniref:Uncharacterized protein n=1 Tax=Petrolisthes manimaculis TaxID=1843537 RepID=A0AAE1P9G4_9EUCA|nr:hypothetical protein Pmani_023426 [Petrolisthes manimaculis]